MSFFTLKESDVINSKYVAYPSYTFNLGYTSETIYVLSSSEIVNRAFSDIEGNAVTSSYNLGGVVSFLTNSAVTTREKRSLNQLKNIYSSSSFQNAENYTSSSIFNPSLSRDNQVFHFLNIPSVLYGSQIKPGSLTLSTSTNHQYRDDGKGGMFSGSLHVGCVMYQHGIALFGSKFNTTSLANVTASFSGTNKIPTNLYLCKVPRGTLNFSNNDSYTHLLSGTTNGYEITTKNPKTLITGIALYDEEHKLVGVAKVSSPILNEEDTGLLFRLKLSF
jgi:hypothetical protein